MQRETVSLRGHFLCHLQMTLSLSLCHYYVYVPQLLRNFSEAKNFQLSIPLRWKRFGKPAHLCITFRLCHTIHNLTSFLKLLRFKWYKYDHYFRHQAMPYHLVATTETKMRPVVTALPLCSSERSTVYVSTLGLVFSRTPTETSFKAVFRHVFSYKCTVHRRWL